ncbi:MAG: LON peptidase substrate-binding domain-containing protein, partial [Chloracidobacterium sp.]|nr:LON peptidase substrate-binding domain-containing protein [Chloracidobacterium sp.]
MASRHVIPIFPLPLVQFPNAITPLHIFEPRYRKMLKDVMEKDKTFGVIYRPSAEKGVPTQFSE